MNIERGAVNRILITGRQTLSPSNWLCGFTSVEDESVVYCVTQNEVSSKGPLLLPIEEKASPVAVDGEVSLAAGDHTLRIYEQTSTTNVNPASAGLRLVWTELVSVQ